MELNHDDVPIAGLGLIDDGEASAGAFKFLDIDLDPIGIFKGLEQGRVRMVTPDQGVEVGRTAGEITAMLASAAAQALRFKDDRNELKMGLLQDFCCLLKK